MCLRRVLQVAVHRHDSRPGHARAPHGCCPKLRLKRTTRTRGSGLRARVRVHRRAVVDEDRLPLEARERMAMRRCSSSTEPSSFNNVTTTDTSISQDQDDWEKLRSARAASDESSSSTRTPSLTRAPYSTRYIRLIPSWNRRPEGRRGWARSSRSGASSEAMFAQRPHWYVGHVGRTHVHHPAAVTRARRCVVGRWLSESGG